MLSYYHHMSQCSLTRLNSYVNEAEQRCAHTPKLFLLILVNMPPNSDHSADSVVPFSYAD